MLNEKITTILNELMGIRRGTPALADAPSSHTHEVIGQKTLAHLDSSFIEQSPKV